MKISESPPVVLLCLLFICVSTVQTQGLSPGKYARERLSELEKRVRIIGIRSACEILVDSTNLPVRLAGVESIRMPAGVDPQYPLNLVSNFVWANSPIGFLIRHKGGDPTNSLLCTFLIGGEQSLQEVLVRNGYVDVGTNASPTIFALCEQAVRERRGLWMVAKPWPTEFAWWTKYVQDNGRSNTFNVAATPQVDLIVLIGHRRRGSSAYPLTPFVITRDHMAKSSDLPGLSGHGHALASDQLVEHVCRRQSSVNIPSSETWTAVFSSSNHVIRGYATFGPELWDGAPEVNGQSITNKIRFIPQYLDSGK